MHGPGQSCGVSGDIRGLRRSQRDAGRERPPEGDVALSPHTRAAACLYLPTCLLEGDT
jgi:hypothetical protein